MELKKKVNFTLPPSTIELLKKMSKEKQLAMSIILQLAIEEYSKNKGGVQECV